jgi:hypothetical protein
MTRKFFSHQFEGIQEEPRIKITRNERRERKKVRGNEKKSTNPIRN